jgi:hypothetical protein
MARGKDFDPFGEHTSLRFNLRQRLLGANVHFSSNSRALLRLVEHAYAGLPAHRFEHKAPDLRVTLQLSPPVAQISRTEPAPLRLLQGSGLLAASTAASDYAVLSPRDRAALVVISEHMSRSSYHARYELIEFAVYTLAARSQELVPLHAACVGIDGRGVLLMGGSGSGKSTLSLQSLVQGFDFVSEDSIFVEPATLRASGIANFLHVRPDALRWLQSSRIATAIRSSPVIKRRSGVEKYELDLRRTPFKLAAAPLQIVAVAFLSARTTRGALLRPVTKIEALTRLADLQAYGTSRPQWRAFARNIARTAVFELRRGGHPAEAAAALRALLAQQ